MLNQYKVDIQRNKTISAVNDYRLHVDLVEQLVVVALVVLVKTLYSQTQTDAMWSERHILQCRNSGPPTSQRPLGKLRISDGQLYPSTLHLTNSMYNSIYDCWWGLSKTIKQKGPKKRKTQA